MPENYSLTQVRGMSEEPTGYSLSDVNKMLKDQSPGILDTLRQDAGNLAAGAVRGAGSIGATIMLQKDMLADALAGKGLSLESNRQRRADMDAALADFGAQPDSLFYKGGKIGAEVAGTLGAGGALANIVKGSGAAGPTAEAVMQGLRTGGFNVNGIPGMGGLAMRAGTGAVNGGVMAGMVNPEDAGWGALLGGVLPVGVKVAGEGGAAIRNFFGGGNKPSPELLASARDALEAGYKIPPATINPSLGNRTLETISGKQATQQMASMKNAEVSKDLVKQALGIAEDVPLNRQTLEGIRQEAGKAYKAIADLPAVPARQASSVMNRAGEEAIKPNVLIEDLKQARNDAQAWFKSYNASANPEHLAKARAADALSGQLESKLESYASSLGADDLVPALREARKKIAQTYTVERALNEATGSIDATVLGKLFKKGKPLSDGLEQVGQFGAAFPTVAKVPEKIGSPDVHNLRSIASLLLGGIGGAGAGPAGIALGAVPYIAPGIARQMMFSPGAQRGLLGGATPALTDSLLLQLGLRSAPVLAAQ